MRGLQYGRPSDRSVEAMLRERRGTCTAKHLYLAERIRERFPETEPRIVHRVYRIRREDAERRHGENVARIVPTEGLVDVHRYLLLELSGEEVTIDATFPGPPWDGQSSLPLACGEGTDYPSGVDANADKRRLEEEHCDAALRERFIAAL